MVRLKNLKRHLLRYIHKICTAVKKLSLSSIAGLCRLFFWRGIFCLIRCACAQRLCESGLQRMTEGICVDVGPFKRSGTGRTKAPILSDPLRSYPKGILIRPTENGAGHRYSRPYIDVDPLKRSGAGTTKAKIRFVTNPTIKTHYNHIAINPLHLSTFNLLFLNKKKHGISVAIQ